MPGKCKRSNSPGGAGTADRAELRYPLVLQPSVIHVENRFAPRIYTNSWSQLGFRLISMRTRQTTLRRRSLFPLSDHGLVLVENGHRFQIRHLVDSVRHRRGVYITTLQAPMVVDTRSA